MKKPLLIALSLIVLTPILAAGELTFTFDGKTVPAGGRVIFDTYETYPQGSQTEVYMEPKIYITKDAADEVNIRTTSNYPIQLCIGGSCEASENILKENLSFNANTPVDLLLDCSILFNKGQEIQIPAIEVLIEAWYADDPSNVTSMILNMGDLATVEGVDSNSDYIRAYGSHLGYNFEKPVETAVFNLAGQPVVKETLQGRGFLELNGLEAGVYIFKAGTRVGKFIIR